MVHCGTLCRAIPIGNRRADTIRPYELKNFERSANYAPGAMRYVCVGADIIRPVGAKRRQCNVKHLQMKFGSIMSEHGTLRHVVPRDSQWESPGGY